MTKIIVIINDDFMYGIIVAVQVQEVQAMPWYGVVYAKRCGKEREALVGM